MKKSIKSIMRRTVLIGEMSLLFLVIFLFMYFSFYLDYAGIISSMQFLLIVLFVVFPMLFIIIYRALLRLQAEKLKIMVESIRETKLDELLSYLRLCIKKGCKKEKIVDACAERGWRKDLIDYIFDDQAKQMYRFEHYWKSRLIALQHSTPVLVLFWIILFFSLFFFVIPYTSMYFGDQGNQLYYHGGDSDYHSKESIPDVEYASSYKEESGFKQSLNRIFSVIDASEREFDKRKSRVKKQQPEETLEKEDAAESAFIWSWNETRRRFGMLYNYTVMDFKETMDFKSRESDSTVEYAGYFMIFVLFILFLILLALVAYNQNFLNIYGLLHPGVEFIKRKIYKLFSHAQKKLDSKIYRPVRIVVDKQISQLYKSDFEEQQAQRERLRAFIRKSLKINLPHGKIVQACVNDNWSKEQVEDLIDKEERKLLAEDLREYVANCIRLNYPKEKIIKEYKNKGWKQENIEKMIEIEYLFQQSMPGNTPDKPDAINKPVQ